MKKNVGPREKYVRLGVGLAALSLLPFTKSRILSRLLGMTMAAGLSTGFAGFCPINRALRIGSPKKAPRKRAAA